MNITPLLLLCTALLLQDAMPKAPSAEEYFAQVGKKYADATSLAFKCDVTFDCEGQAGTGTITVSSPGGNGFKVDARLKVKDRAVSIIVTSDGKQIVTEAAGQTQKGPAPEKADVALRRLMHEQGVLQPLNWGINTEALSADAKMPHATSFKFLDDEKIGERKLRVLEIGIEEHGKPGATAKLWIDPGMLYVVKRHIKGAADRKIDIVEIYADVVFNAAGAATK